MAQKINCVLVQCFISSHNNIMFVELTVMHSVTLAESMRGAQLFTLYNQPGKVKRNTSDKYWKKRGKKGKSREIASLV